jgi:hypothetical protein
MTVVIARRTHVKDGPSRPRWVPISYQGRWLVIQGLAVAALSHLPSLRERLAEAPYAGWLIGLFVVLCAALIVPLCLHDSRMTYWFTTFLSAAAVLSYFATRLLPFPQLSRELGNWAEPWDVVAVLSEIFTISTALLALTAPGDGAAGEATSWKGDPD